MSRGRFWATVFMVAVLVIGIGLFTASRVSAGKYAISPGSAQPVAPLISIQGHKQVDGSGKIMLTDVLLTPVTWLNYLWFKFDSNNQFVPESALVPPGVSADQLSAQGYLEMAQSKDAARTAALRRLGYTVDATAAGAVVTAVHVADVITAVNGHAVTSSCGVISSVHDLSPGTSVSLSVEVATIHPDGTITNGAPVTRTVVLGTPLHPTASNCPGVSGPAKSYLGVALEDDVTYRYPISISISTPNIGGPSAGLAMTLGIIDELSGGSLVRKTTMAATGTIDPEGNVGDVGGVPQKTVAVSRAGASLFLVPEVEFKAAKSKAPTNLKVTAVGTLDQALNQLFALGGSIRMADGSIQSRTSAH